MQAVTGRTRHAGEDIGSSLRRLLACTAALIAGIFARGLAWALPACPASPSIISSCCVANQPGKTYALGANLIAPGECIDISAPKVVLSMNGFGITGPGATGIGIHVLSTAPNGVIFWGPPVVVENFATGFQSDALNTFAFEPETDFNNRGMVLNGPDAFVVGAVARANVKNGIVLTAAASGSFMFGPASQVNGANGIVLNGTTGVILWKPQSLANVGYGLWLKGAFFNSVIEPLLEENTIAGAYLGCHASGPSPAACSIPPSNDNSISGGTVGSSCTTTPAPQAYGIAIDTGNAHNHVLFMAADTNSNCTTPGDTIFDGFDGNGPACARNFWFANSFPLKNHAPSSTFPLCID